MTEKETAGIPLTVFYPFWKIKWKERNKREAMKQSKKTLTWCCLCFFCILMISSFSTMAAGRQTTIKELLQTGLQPVGSTMYVWGGGWSRNGASKEARRLGVSTSWKKFYKKQKKGYNYHKYLYQSSKGLDCSGYIGWCIYNVLEETDGKKGYVLYAQNMARNYASRGWGTFTNRSKVKNYKAGDIMSTPAGHVYMVIGSCKDGSVVFLHSSPPGVTLCGTTTPSGKTNSQAVKLARKYMKKYYPAWYKKFGDCSRGISYLTDYHQMRWDISGKSVMTDPDHYRKKSAEQILKDLFRKK